MKRVGLPAFLAFALSAFGFNVEGQTWKHFRGMCDASALEMLTDDLFVVGNDEDNVLRVYSRSQEGLPVQELDFSSFYGLRKRTHEIDIEGSARIGNLIYWISSHGANKKGKFQPSRHRLFATEIITNNGAIQLRPAGKLCATLLRDLMSHPPLAPLNLRAASTRPPKSRNALNIEGLAPTAEGHLLIAFRNPIPNGNAVIVPLLNPEAVTSGQKAHFGDPFFLDLHGLGVRSITPHDRGYIIVAGPYNGDGVSQLFYWDGKSLAPRLFLPEGLPGNPEGISVLTVNQTKVLFALSDDGTQKIGGTDCKKLKDDSLKVFRGFELPLPSVIGDGSRAALSGNGL